MTDDLVERLLDWPYQGETMAHEAADRIEALTAGHEALEQDNHRWKMECENFWRDREKTLTAECDRLREALEYILAECTLSDNTMPSVGAIKYAARTALKGESHE